MVPIFLGAYAFKIYLKNGERGCYLNKQMFGDLFVFFSACFAFWQKNKEMILQSIRGAGHVCIARKSCVQWYRTLFHFDEAHRVYRETPLMVTFPRESSSGHLPQNLQLGCIIGCISATRATSPRISRKWKRPLR